MIGWYPLDYLYTVKDTQLIDPRQGSGRGDSDFGLVGSLAI